MLKNYAIPVMHVNSKLWADGLHKKWKLDLKPRLLIQVINLCTLSFDALLYSCFEYKITLSGHSTFSFLHSACENTYIITWRTDMELDMALPLSLAAKFCQWPLWLCIATKKNPPATKKAFSNSPACCCMSLNVEFLKYDNVLSCLLYISTLTMSVHK